MLFRKFERILFIMTNLSKRKLHRSIQDEDSVLMEQTDMDLEKAISRVLTKHKYDFDELLETEDSTDDEESDEEEEEEEEEEESSDIDDSDV